MVLYGIDTKCMAINPDSFYAAVTKVKVSVPCINCPDIRMELDRIADGLEIPYVHDAVRQFLSNADRDGVGTAQVLVAVINARQEGGIFLSADNDLLGIMMDDPWGAGEANMCLGKERFFQLLSDEIKSLTGTSIGTPQFYMCGQACRNRKAGEMMDGSDNEYTEAVRNEEPEKPHASLWCAGNNCCHYNTMTDSCTRTGRDGTPGTCWMKEEY